MSTPCRPITTKDAKQNSRRYDGVVTRVGMTAEFLHASMSTSGGVGAVREEVADWNSPHVMHTGQTGQPVHIAAVVLQIAGSGPSQNRS